MTNLTLSTLLYNACPSTEPDPQGYMNGANKVTEFFATAIDLKVTESHIKRGLPRDANSCAITLALLSAGYPDATTEPTEVQYYNPLTLSYWRAELPAQAVSFIDYFDDDNFDHDLLTPFTIHLEFKEVND